MTVAAILKGKTVHPSVSMGVAPGSRQVYEQIARNGALADLIASGARILESSCGPCIGMGQAPPSNAVSVRSFNRNFEGRSGTPSAGVYLASPETCAAAALSGTLSDPRKLGAAPRFATPEEFIIDDRMVLAPAEDSAAVQVIRGPNNKPLPINRELPAQLQGEVLLKVGDNITTDHIMPAGAKVLPLRSNIPAIAEYVFSGVDPAFAARAKQRLRLGQRLAPDVAQNQVEIAQAALRNVLHFVARADPAQRNAGIEIVKTAYARGGGEQFLGGRKRIWAVRGHDAGVRISKRAPHTGAHFIPGRVKDQFAAGKLPQIPVRGVVRSIPLEEYNFVTASGKRPDQGPP
jgi:hypothetical protein